MPTADYLAMTGVRVYIMLEHPGAWAPPEGQRLTHVQLTLLLEERKNQLEHANQALELEHTLKQMIIKAVAEQYLAILRNQFTGTYKGQSVHQILTHLKRTVATLTDNEVQKEYDGIAATPMIFYPDGI